MKSPDDASASDANSPPAGEVNASDAYFLARPIGDPACPDCGGGGHVHHRDWSHRCDCMPPFIVFDRETGFQRFGHLLLDGRKDGRPISQVEAEYRHQKGLEIVQKVTKAAGKRVAEMERGQANITPPAEPAPKDIDGSSTHSARHNQE